MAKNLERTGGLVHSQRVLLALTQRGVSREDAYAAVQRNAMQVWRDGGQFIDVLKADPAVRTHLSDAELAELFDQTWHFAHVDTIFERVFGADAVHAKAAAE
jgi:adenylosuccinate lyase